MKIFPAIDIKDKKCVRLIKGDFENKTEYEMSPVEQAGKYKQNGFKNLHIVDLDGALTGEPINIDIIEDIVGKFDLKVEIGGGTLEYMSPELQRCVNKKTFKSLTPKSDVWGVGILTCLLFLHNQPYEDKSCHKTIENVQKNIYNDINNCIKLAIKKKLDMVFTITESTKNPYFNFIRMRLCLLNFEVDRGYLNSIEIY